MTYEVDFKPEVSRQLVALDRRVGQRILDKLKWLSQNVEGVTHTSLKHDLSDFYKLRIGDYRVLYTLDADQHRLEVHALGHRRDIYDLDN